jgi:Pyruvate/2-oxoacid:ferredoxin oxidoreductase gamma subunit
MERELIVTGIGGQGVQLAASVLAHAAAAEGRGVQLFGSYGGMMRGGDTTATLIVADGLVVAPPTVGSTWSAILMHHEHADAVIQRLRPNSVAFVNTSIIEGDLDTGCTTVPVAATDVATDLGNPLLAAMVMVGAYIAGTGLVEVDAAVSAVADVLPPYRQQLVEPNGNAIRAGHEQGQLVAGAWAAPAEVSAS